LEILNLSQDKSFMKTLWIIGLVAFTLTAGLALAQKTGGSPVSSATPATIPVTTPVDTSMPNPTNTPSVPKPSYVQSKDRVPDSDNPDSPPHPSKASDGSELSAINDDAAPRGPALQNLGDPAFLSAVGGFNKSENNSKTYYWHSLNAWDYCHWRDGSRQWYGWKAGEKFHWVLSKGGHFYWHDTYAERWLCFDRGYWWWQGHLKSKPFFEVYLDDGHYYVCDANGVLGEDLGTTGKVDIATEPVSKDTTPMPDSGSPSSPGSGLMHNAGMP
jgi:hypothetical protein